MKQFASRSAEQRSALDSNQRRGRALPGAPIGGLLRFAAIAVAALAFAISSPAAEAKKAAAQKPVAENPKDDGARIIIEGHFPGTKPEEKEPKLIYSAKITTQIILGQTGATQRDWITIRRHQGRMKELRLMMHGDGTPNLVKSPARESSGIMWDEKNRKTMVVRIKPAQQTNDVWQFEIQTQTTFKNLPATFTPLSHEPEAAVSTTGSLRIEPNTSRITYAVSDRKGLISIEPGEFQPVAKTRRQAAGAVEQQAYQYSSAPWSFRISVAESDPDARKIRLKNFQLTGEIAGENASFTLTGTAQVNHPDGGEFELLGPVALKRYAEYPNVSLRWNGNKYVLKFARSGEFPVEIEFDAKVTDEGAMKRIHFDPPPAALRPVTIKGLPKGTQLLLSGAAEPELKGDAYVSHLAPKGPLTLQWQPAREDVESKLFYSVTGLSQISVSPGLIRQTQVMDYKVMQGKMQSLKVKLIGDGEVTRVHCDGILTWRVDASEEAGTRMLTVQLNQAKTDALMLTIQSEFALGAFPLDAKPMRAIPEEAIRYGGHLRVVNSGAVRLEVVNAAGLVQVSPQRFPQNQIIGKLASQQKPQAYRFSGADFDLEVRADNILPELTVSELLVYQLGETETRIEAELELEIREAPLREFAIEIPADYSVSQLNVPNLANYDVAANANGATELRVQFTQPLMGRQVMSVRLTHNHDAPEANWTLPPIRPQQVKSVRGFVGVSADAGLRLAAGQVSGATEIATAFFPRQIKDLQLAWRLRDAAWTAAVASERLALSIQADALQLFSIGEGIAYGSAVMNYLISGAPVSKLRVAASTNFANIEFTGREVRNWRATTNGYEIELHTPISGAYTLLATYDLQFDPEGATLDFQGVTPQDVQSEQGHVIVVSPNQFLVEDAVISPELIRLETGEVPAEYRLLFDAPILAAFQYTSRPFQAGLKLTSLKEDETVRQVVDRATFETQISSEGQALTVAKYFVKSVGLSHLRIVLPAGSKIWSSSVNGKEAVLHKDGDATLVPLPQNVGPNTVIPIELKFGVPGEESGKVGLQLPKVAAPVLLADWNVRPDPGYRLIHDGGQAAPNAQSRAADVSGFAWLQHLLNGRWGRDRSSLPLGICIVLAVGAVIWRWGTGEGVHRYDKRNILGVIVGGGVIVVGAILLAVLFEFSVRASQYLPPSVELAYTLPVQTPGSGIGVELKNVEMDGVGLGWLRAWPILLGLAAWFYALGKEPGFERHMLVSAGWASHAWGALRIPNGGWLFVSVGMAVVFFHLVIPLIRRQLDLPKRPDDPDPEPEAPADEPGDPDASGGSDSAAPAAGAAALMLIAQLFGAGDLNAAQVKEPPAVPFSVRQEARVADDVASVKAVMNWTAREGDRLDILKTPAVLTEISYSTNIVKLVQEAAGKTTVYRLLATQAGKVEIRFGYQVGVAQRKTVFGFDLPTHHGLVNELTLNLDSADVEIVSANVVSVRSLQAKTGESRFDLALGPVSGSRIEWRPRSRDARDEKTVFFAEMRQLFVPTAGVIEGSHDAQIRPAQGQVDELVFTTPETLTITDVKATSLRSWRFDPDARKLRVQFSPPQTKPFAVRIHSQVSTSPLPYQRAVGMISVDEATRDIGLVGVATGSDVQLGDTTTTALSRINLEDFPGDLVAEGAKQVAGLTLRRAFRYADTAATVGLSADAVAPDIRVASRQNLLLSEDRVVLGANLTVAILRAGVFNLSFVLPDGMDVESITGEALSHWTELTVDNRRIVKLHLNGKTTGQISFAINLVGPGAGGRAAIDAPRLSLVEADKESGQLIVSPEQGMRLRSEDREGVMQLDPKREGITQQGALAFRLLQSDWKIGFVIETVTPWVEVESLQDVTIREGQLKATVHLNYKIENAGVKSLFFDLPTAAESVRFTGDHVADSIKSEEDNGGLTRWEVKLDRRILQDGYKLRLNYQVGTPQQPTQQNVVGVQAVGVNMQGAYLTIRAGGRLQVTPGRVPGELQRVDWQSVPVQVRREAGKSGGSFTFDAINPQYQLTVNVARHSAAESLPSRVESIELSSLVSDKGMMLTETKLTLHPGDRRILRFKLPAGADFWFGFVDGLSARPWAEGEFILIPFESPAEKGNPVRVEFLYSLQTTLKTGGKFDLGVSGPVFELPLQNITWNVFLPPTWKLEEEDERMQLQEAQVAARGAAIDVNRYVQSQTAWQEQKMKDAERMLAVGNDSLVKGNQRNALQSFKSALNLSQHDDAFNEDARVQLHNLKLQQALVGLNNRANGAFVGQAAAPSNSVAIQAEGEELRYTDKQVREALNRNAADANAALMKLAEELVEQQEAAQATPEAIQAALPEYGQRLTFTRSMIVDEKSADLKLELEVSEEGGAGLGQRFLLLVGILFAFAILMGLGKRRSGDYRVV